ncbi:Wzz/FepE/Etk N-terminal domain-containing protein [Kaistia defluvii]|uniref:GumC family protein n=1 Tax=Kaistia defluvii TaxID=410841 RepID=UPI0022557385|nr:Wzz/FepE/Etk N-terminal domain-containing protein [Kaistia defluvii]MCX5520261.1 Wzz/FepE/Etk N-terminal domain-containing protein [Kaistia defluvii]
MTDGRSGQIDDVELDMRALFGALLRALPWLLLSSVLFAGALYIGLNFVTPRYTAETKILIESGESEITRAGAGADEVRALLDSEGVASQVQLIGSRDLATTVVDSLGLASLKEFNKPRFLPSFDQMLVRMGLGRPVAEGPLEERVLQRFADKLDVFSIDKTRVITVGFSSTDPQLAARVANAVADEYLALEREARRSTNADATRWLESQIADLRTKVTTAEGKVEAFRTEHGLFSGGQNNTSLAQQKLNDLNAELARLVAARSAAEAKAATVRKSLSSGTTPDVPDVRDSQLIQRLREQQVALRAQIAQMSATLLPAHPRLRELNAQLADLDAQVRREVTRILQSLEGEAATARAREADIGQDLTRAKAATGQTNNDEVELRALEREATAQRDLLESYLKRYREASSRQDGNYLPADARIISRAAVPLEPAFPKKLPITAAATIALLLLAIAIILIRELTSGRALRRISVEPPPPPALAADPVEDRKRWNKATPEVVPTLVTAGPALGRVLSAETQDALNSIVDHIVDSKARRVLVSMPEPDASGRPLAAVALARALSRRGNRVLLIDLHADGADSKAMAAGERLPGLTDLFAGIASFAQVIFRDRRSRAHLIPHGLLEFEPEAAKGERFVSILEALDQTYDQILLDADADMALQMAPQAGAVILVTEGNADDAGATSAVEAMKAATSAEVMVLIATAPSADEEDATPEAAVA